VPGTAEIVVEYSGVRSEPVTLALVPASPGIFTQEYGPGQAWVFNQDGSANGASNRAARGSFVAFYATGPGVTDPVLPDGEHPSGGVFPLPVNEVRVLLNGEPIPQSDVFFRNLTFAGVMQVNFRIPADAPSGAAVSLKLSIGGIRSRDGVTMAIE
jgi:uncharacterized protein (TIGR03437 family)